VNGALDFTSHLRRIGCCLRENISSMMRDAEIASMISAAHSADGAMSRGATQQSTPRASSTATISSAVLAIRLRIADEDRDRPYAQDPEHLERLVQDCCASDRTTRRDR
jgi:hypothetical protein